MSIPVPEKLTLRSENKCRNWKVFHQAWRHYEIATNLLEATGSKRLATFLTVIGPEAIDVYNTFDWRPSETKNLNSVMKKFESYCNPKKNQTFERYTFLTRKQHEAESVSDYRQSLKSLSTTCEYGSLEDSCIRARWQST